jgi:hypothetical protein
LWRRNEIGSRPLDGEPLGLPRRPSGGAARTPLWRRRVLLGASNRDGGKRRRCTRRETAEVRPTRCTPRPAIQPRQANRADRLAPIIFIVCFASLLLYMELCMNGGYAYACWTNFRGYEYVKLALDVWSGAIADMEQSQLQDLTRIWRCGSTRLL